MNNEVELVLVGDHNDFVDPLDLGVEYDDGNDELKLDLDDDIEDEPEFHIGQDVHEATPIDPNGFDDLATSGKCAPTKVGRTNAERQPSIDSLDSIDCDNRYGDNRYDDTDSDDYFVGAKDSKADVKRSVQPEAEQRPQRIASDTVIKTTKTEPSETVDSTEPLDGQTSDSDSEDSRKSRKRTKKAPRTTAKKAKQAKQTSTKQRVKRVRKEPTEPRVYKHKKDYRKLLQQYEEMKKVDPNCEKPTRKYTKRNTVPKVTEHNEAYDTKLLKCKECHIQFDRSPPFTEHMRDKHAIDKPFECHICGKGYRISSLLAEHIRYHFGEKPYSCEHCGKGFCQLQPYKTHIRKFHTFEKPYKCTFVDQNGVECGVSFFDTKTLNAHSLSHSDKHPYACDECGKKFNHSGAYQTHLRIHRNERPYQCSVCGKSFVQMSSYRTHMLTHSDVFNFPCTECDKKFKQAHNLRLHMRVHTKETPYICEDCGRQFAQSVTYRCHRRLHTGEKPYNCTYDECPRSFRHKNSLRRHLQAHTGQRPYQCEVCAKPLSSPATLAKHMRKHERRGEKPAESPDVKPDIQPDIQPDD